MSIFYRPYQILTMGLFIFLLPVFWGYARVTRRHGQHLKERLGFVPRQAVEGLSGSPRIWIHAVSLGEIKVAAALIEVLEDIMPGCSIIVSVFTEHGRQMARETFSNNIPVVYAPVDFVGSVRKSLLRIRPDAMVFLETELWPTWLFESHRMGVKTALINGRISERSIASYLRLRPFFREVLINIDIFSMIGKQDADRIKSMGADPARIHINGNAKYDLLGAGADPAIEADFRRLLNLERSRSVFVAGNTRHGEEEMILDVYEKILAEFPDILLIIVPRHIDRTPAIVSMVKKRGFNCQLRTDLGENKARRTEKVVIINTFGELFKVYSIATIVFSGASFVPLGGQNPLEPAIWGKVVFYGPSMEDFADAKELLEEAEAGVPVSSPGMLAEKLIWFLHHPKALNAYGKRAREAVLKNLGAAGRHAQIIKDLVAKK